MGRPRKLRPDEFSVTVPPVAGEVHTTAKQQFLPYYGSSNLAYGEKRYFVAQGKKLIVKYYAVRSKDAEGNPIYKLASKCVTNISRNKKGQALAKMLKNLKIPGAENIGL